MSNEKHHCMLQSQLIADSNRKEKGAQIWMLE